MKSIVSTSLILGGLLLCGSAISGFAAETTKSEPKWNITGDLEEACSCHPPCPCWFKSLPSRMTCDGAQAVFISKGRYGNTPLDGLAVAVFVQSPEGKSMFESYGNWPVDNVYIDGKANESQRAALKVIADHLFPVGGQSRSVSFAPITRTVQKTEHTITVGDIGSFSGHLLEGGYPGSPKLSNVPLADPTHREFLQGQTTRLTYTEGGRGWKYQDSNYMFNRFKVNNQDYEQYEADLAKKLAELKHKEGK